MKKYFYTDGSNNYGPYTLEELKQEKISRDTKVWFQGLDEWKSAGSIAELEIIFKLTPPPLTNPTFSHTEKLINNKPPKNWLVESILVTLFCCLPFGIAGIVNAAKVESRFYAGDFVGANKSSGDAKKWTMVALGLGIAFWLVYFLLIVLSLVSEY